MQERDSDEPAGRRAPTDHRAGDTVPEGTLVTVFYSDGPEEVPGVVGLQRREAEQSIRDAGFEPRVVRGHRHHRARGHGHRAEPGAGEDAREGSTVTIVVSAFEEPPSPRRRPSRRPRRPPPPDETIPPTESPGVQRSLAPGRDQRSGSA